jgi:hypothetical protein
MRDESYNSLALSLALKAYRPSPSLLKSSNASAEVELSPLTCPEDCRHAADEPHSFCRKGTGPDSPGAHLLSNAQTQERAVR